ncbi:MAG: bifunctional diaminohydroxyphosphoribosylaminopyrimidine deaminase/5-amino-6-(5-phosphoribosylamino)uracil reductase RibD [Planctomycetota bacterium]
MSDHHDGARRLMRRATRLALRGHGGAEPNPMVGCVLVAPDGSIVGEGYHRRCGGPHAELVALQQAGGRARGATAYVTLEPCDHSGRTGPCSRALIDANVARVVIARPDPTPLAGGGADRLRSAGVDVQFLQPDRDAWLPSEPFAHRAATGRPWVIAKWAQTVDGRIATRTGESQWISGERSRRLVHRERGRVDAILTGIGTVLADDPRLTARGVRRRRTARRVVVDPELRTPDDARLLQTLDDAALTLLCTTAARRSGRGATLEARGVELLDQPAPDGQLALDVALGQLVDRHDMTCVLVEAGAGLLGRLFRAALVNEAWVFVGPLVLGDEDATPAVVGCTAAHLTDGVPLELLGTYRRGDDVLLRYLVRKGEDSPQRHREH